MSYEKVEPLQTAESGLQWADLVVGDGAPAQPGMILTVRYVGWLSGAQDPFDSSPENDAFQFPLGQGQVIKGWDLGLLNMKVGGKRRLVIPPHLGYGSREFPGIIPANSTLVFDVHLLDARAPHAVITDILAKHDIEGLIGPLDQPDEYEPEAKLIFRRLAGAPLPTVEAIMAVVYESFAELFGDAEDPYDREPAQFARIATDIRDTWLQIWGEGQEKTNVTE